MPLPLLDVRQLVSELHHVERPPREDSIADRDGGPVLEDEALHRSLEPGQDGDAVLGRIRLLLHRGIYSAPELTPRTCRTSPRCCGAAMRRRCPGPRRPEGRATFYRPTWQRGGASRTWRGASPTCTASSRSKCPCSRTARSSSAASAR